MDTTTDHFTPLALRVRGNNTLNATITCNITRATGIHFSKINKVTITFINIEHCGTDFGKKVQAALHVSQASLLIMAHVLIEHSRGYGLYVERVMETQLKHCCFNYNYYGLGYNCYTVETQMFL